MEGLLTSGRGGPFVLALVASAGAAGEVITRSETLILNVPVSMLFMALAGTMIGFYLLPRSDTAKLSEHKGGCWKKRAVYWLFTSIPLVGFIICYAFIAAWVVQAGLATVHTLTRLTIEDGVILPGTALVGVGIRPWLPALLVAVQRRAEKVIGGE